MAFFGGGFTVALELQLTLTVDMMSAMREFACTVHRILLLPLWCLFIFYSLVMCVIGITTKHHFCHILSPCGTTRAQSISFHMYFNVRVFYNFCYKFILCLSLFIPLTVSSCYFQAYSLRMDIPPMEIDLCGYFMYSHHGISSSQSETLAHFCPYILIDRDDCDTDIVALLNTETHIISSGERDKLKLHENRIDIPKGSSGVIVKRYILNPKCADMAANSVSLMDAFVVKITTPDGINFYAWLPSKYINNLL